MTEIKRNKNLSIKEIKVQARRNRERQDLDLLVGIK